MRLPAFARSGEVTARAAERRILYQRLIREAIERAMRR